MRHSSIWPILALAVILLLVLFGCGAFLKKSYDCDAKGGELVRKLNGTYTCMEDE